MQGFQKIVLITAGVVFLFALILMATAMLQESTETWPPLIAKCPDWWLINGSGKNSTCINVKDLGTNAPQEVNFNLPRYNGRKGLCQKSKWAKGFGISWDGITYGVDNPCITKK